MKTKSIEKKPEANTLSQAVLHHIPQFQVIIASRQDIAYSIQLFQVQPQSNTINFIIVVDEFDNIDIKNISPKYSTLNPKVRLVDTLKQPVSPDRIYIISPWHLLKYKQDRLLILPAKESHTLQTDNLETSIETLIAYNKIQITRLITLGKETTHENLVALLAAAAQQTYFEFNMSYSSINTNSSNETHNHATPAAYQTISRKRLLENLANESNNPQKHPPSHTTELEPNRNPLTSSKNNYRQVLNWLNQNGHIDFSHYRQSWLASQIESRKAKLGFSDTQAYIKFCFSNFNEYGEFARGLSKTRYPNDDLKQFYQQLPHICEALAHDSLSDHNSPTDDTIRVWIPGSGYGEEAYLFAIAWSNYCQINKINKTIKIFATDIQAEVIRQAARGITEEQTKILEKVVPIQDWITGWVSGLAQMGTLRQSILFTSHDLISSPPLSNMDLIICRNVLWMLKQASANTIINHFHRSLKKNGFLLSDENSLPHPSLVGFKVCSDVESHTLFVKEKPIDQYQEMDYSRMVASHLKPPSQPPPLHNLLQNHRRHNRYSDYSEILNQIIDAFAPPGFLVDDKGHIVHIFGDTTPFTSLFSEGPFSKDLFSRALPELREVLIKTIKAVFTKQAPNIIQLDETTNATFFKKNPTLKLSHIQLNYYESKVKQHQQFCGLFFHYHSNSQPQSQPQSNH